MATVNGAGLPPVLMPSTHQDDPFNPTTTPSRAENRKSSHRFSAFDTQLFASYQPAASPATAKRALEAHLSETDKRLEEASKLGTALVQQRQDLTEKLKEVEEHLDGQEIGPELRQQLVEVEKEYNELGRESARAFLAHKSRAVSGGDGESRSASPTKFSSQATDSPSKMSVPSRKQRNQPTNRVGDIEFVTQISTSLLGQVRQLQAVLAEREDTIRTITSEKSNLELDNEGLLTRLKALDENEQRYKDENWSLETQTHELMAAAKDGSTRESKLQQALALMTSQKNAAQRELDDVKVAHGKVSDDLAVFKKNHDAETSGLRKNAASHDTEREIMQKRIDELTSQNQELAKAVAGTFRRGDDAAIPALGAEPEEFFLDGTDTDHSPPASPTKGAARSSMLESETLKSSLGHAHRMIQNLKGNIHREKTEKLELKRLLQETRDELEQRRNDVNGTSKRPKTKPQDVNKKAIRIGQLGAGRQPETSIETEDGDWVDHDGDFARPALARTATADTTTDAYQTANETEDAFETADERATETEAFQTGNEGAGYSSEELTETEDAATRAARASSRPVPVLPYPNKKRESFISTASDSDQEGSSDLRTPVGGSLRDRKSFRGNRGSRFASQEPSSSPATARDSPASFVGAGNGQSLSAELGDLEFASDDDTTSTASRSINSTPARGPSSSFIATPSKLSNSTTRPETPRAAMVETSTSTDTPETDRRRPLTAFVAATTAGLSPKTPVKNTTDSGYQPSREATPARQDTGFQPNTPLYTKKDVGVQQSRETTPARQDTGFQPTTPLYTGKDVGVQRTRENTPIPMSRSLANEGTQVTPARALPPKSLPNLQFAYISATDIRPTTPPSTLALADASESRPSTAIQSTSTPSQEAQDVAKGGVIGSVLGWAIGKKQSTPAGNSEIDTPTKPRSRTATPRQSLVGASSPANNLTAKEVLPLTASPAPKAVLPIPMADNGAQTTLSSAQIDSLLLAKAAKPSPAALPALNTTKLAEESPTREPLVESPALARPATSTGTSYSLTPRETPYPPSKSPRRPGSAQSYRSSLALGAPPLPAHHRQAIAAAQSTPVRNRDSKAEGSMGPPTMTAAAYRAAQKQAQRDGDPQTPGSISSATPRARYSTARSARSRRSSMSSFESELDTRFNIRAGDIPMGGFDGGTDPRMIQAITQTMIGEFLWKYTRKAGRGEMSDKRHRRFFWVHPYTRTLYWSDTDPSTAGRAQLKAKSVAIEAVRVVADDNPMPPGLHRKSLVVITPGRDIKFTATTGQRHETWFNALSYLLLRSTDGEGADVGGITAEDVAEFNPSFGNRGAAGSRVSLSSYNSRTNTTRRSIASIRGISPDKSTITRRIPATPHSTNATRNSHHGGGGGDKNFSLSSRLSSYWRPKSSYEVTPPPALQAAQAGEQGSSIYNASVVNDSAEDVRKVLERQDLDSDRLENVRACCDGKHDVGSLNRRSAIGRAFHKH